MNLRNLTFTFDSVFDSQCPQSVVYDNVGKETIQDIINGYNGTIFAYGQTGSGKTYTMFGPQIFDDQFMGIIPRTAQHIFEFIRNCDLDVEYEMRCSMLEIYKERLRDLLSFESVELKIKESPIRSVYVEGLSENCVICEEEFMELIERGEKDRKVASTNINKFSSRSHSIFIVQLTQKFPNGTEKRGILNLVDLAGSERVGKTGAEGQLLEEAMKINLSLSCLGKVIQTLCKGQDHIPYRESKLTRILQDSLGGNFKTSLVVACSPCSCHEEESLSTIKFAQRAKHIKNKVKMNIKRSTEHLYRIIDQLKIDLEEAKLEIERLKKCLSQLYDVEGSEVTTNISENVEMRQDFLSIPSSQKKRDNSTIEGKTGIFNALSEGRQTPNQKISFNLKNL